MTRSVFYSFHYIPDNQRAAKVRNIGAITGNKPASDNDWESIKAGGDAAITKWIADQIFGKSCAVVLVGSKTAGRKWVNHEIVKAWNDNKGVVGIHIHNLTNLAGEQSLKGANPFASLTVGQKSMSSIVQCYDAPRSTSVGVYSYIADNIAAWIEEAITIRKNN